MKKRKLHCAVLMVMLAAALPAGCGKKETARKADTAAESSFAETEEEQEPNETEPEKTESETESATEKFENDVFSVLFNKAVFELDESQAGGGSITFHYTGECKHPVSMTVSYIDGESRESLMEKERNIQDGSEIIVDGHVEVTLWDGPVDSIQKEKKGEDGISDYVSMYCFDYGKGAVTICINDYFEEEDDIAYAFGGYMEELLNSVEFKKEAEESENISEDVGMSNPWVEADAEKIAEELGLSLAIPEGAENVSYFMLPEEGLEEMRFLLNGTEYCARVKAGAEAEDISGMYYSWNEERSCKIDYCEGTVKTAEADNEYVAVCLWFDIVPGLNYSVSAAARDGERPDVESVARAVFEPAQGEVG